MPDKYTYPNSEVLKNKFGVCDLMLLQDYERKYTSLRLVELKLKPIKGDFDFAHLKKIHRYLFQDVYTWAGKVREMNLARVDNGKITVFCQTHILEGYSDDIFGKLRNKNYLKNLDPNSFASKAAEVIGELNILHPFREGNGRTQREFLRELALNAGWELNFENVSHERMVEASVDAYKMDYSKMEDIIKESLRPLGKVQSPEKELRLKEIEAAPPVSKLGKLPQPKSIYNSYAKEELAVSNGNWDSLDQKIALRLMKDGFSDLKIDAVLKHSPIMIGKNLIDKSINVRKIKREVKRNNPDIEKSR